MKKINIIIAFAVMVSQNCFAKTFILVHGAMIDGTAWHKIVKPFEDAGNKVAIVNLPSHDKDGTKFTDVNYNACIAVIKDSINAQNGKVILAGHSMAGRLISSIASGMPEKTESLVYVAACMPQSAKVFLN